MGGAHCARAKRRPTSIRRGRPRTGEIMKGGMTYGVLPMDSYAFEIR
jgi:hypothetical protein